MGRTNTQGKDAGDERDKRLGWTPGYLDGDGEQLASPVQVEQTQRSRHVGLFPIDHVGRDAVQNLVVQKIQGPLLPHETEISNSWRQRTAGSWAALTCSS